MQTAAPNDNKWQEKLKSSWQAPGAFGITALPGEKPAIAYESELSGKHHQPDVAYLVRWARACLRQPQCPSAAPQWEQLELELAQTLRCLRGSSGELTLACSNLDQDLCEGSSLGALETSLWCSRGSGSDTPGLHRVTAAPPVAFAACELVAYLELRAPGSELSTVELASLRCKLAFSLLPSLRQLSGRINMPIVEA
ncbi:unnamed protein product [Pleuronectes platessa]|uniref:Uncharacterized protein n=1 Tax=Pleuronectes platessa TaxID=8262 RepID=A0A9N7TP43_PLEPL|nr:unnamed protein product [Pleuronectes platessa]